MIVKPMVSRVEYKAITKISRIDSLKILEGHGYMPKDLDPLERARLVATKSLLDNKKGLTRLELVTVGEEFLAYFMGGGGEIYKVDVDKANGVNMAEGVNKRVYEPRPLEECMEVTEPPMEAKFSLFFPHNGTAEVSEAQILMDYIVRGRLANMKANKANDRNL